MNTLFESYLLNSELELKNRIIMAPMTRNMAHDDQSPTETMADYYAKRAAAGLIITEGTIIREDGKGYGNVPGIYAETHIEAWKKVTDKVHKNGGKIFIQIWHAGRVSHPHFLNNELPLSPSETSLSGPVHRAKDLFYGKSRSVTVEEIKGLVVSYAKAAENARRAGFDGVEVHGANGYLIDQFLHYCTNLRTDDYGKTPENMARFALDIVKACGEAIGYQCVGLRLSPGGYLNEIVTDKRDAKVFQYLLTELNSYPIAYIHTGTFNDKIKYPELFDKNMTEFMREYYKGHLIACGSYNFPEASTDIKTNKYDLLAVGRAFIANPDLISRLQNKQDLKPYDASLLTQLI